MLTRIFDKLTGTRKPLPNETKDKVIIFCWDQTTQQTAKHLALEVRKGDEIHYLSFSPMSTEGMDKLSFLQLRTGREALFKRSFADETLVLGYRKTQAHDSKVEAKTYYEQLELASSLPQDVQSNLRERGAPDQLIVLHSLNLDKMIKRIQSLKQQIAHEESKEFKQSHYKTKWASWSSAFFHQEDTYNCSSIVLNVLYEGGLDTLIQSTYHDILGAAGAFLGVCSFFSNGTLLTAAYNVVKGFLIGRGIGGAYEGWAEIQSLIDISAVENATKHKEESTLAVIGLRLAIMSLSSLVSLIKSGPIIPEWLLSTPQTVIERVIAAKQEEDAVYIPRTKLA